MPKSATESSICSAPKCRHVGRRVIISIEGEDNVELVLCDPKHISLVRILQAWTPSRSRGVTPERLQAIRFD